MTAQIIDFEAERFARVTIPRLDAIAAAHVEKFRDLARDRLTAAPDCPHCKGTGRVHPYPNIHHLESETHRCWCVTR